LSKFRKGFALVVLVALVALAAAVSAFGGSSRALATVAVTAGKPAELRFTVLPKTVAKGLTTFKVTNKGTLSHDFKIAGKKTVLIKPGKTVTLKVTLKAGKFAYLCTVPGHAAAGMKGTLTAK
jgi:uncharacterized cupredoxin-like copper-binding protein